MNKNIILIVLAIVIVAAAGGVFYMSTTKAPESAMESIPPEQITPTPIAPAPPSLEPSMQPSPSPSVQSQGNTPQPQPAVKEFIVTGQNFSFSPSTIKVKKGDRVKIVFVNSAGLHDFVVDEFGAATKQIQGGTQEVIEFTADKVGTFEYYCSVGKHRAMGMKGALTVE